MKPGVYDSLSNAEYHGGPGISKSGLDLISRSPMHYRAAKSAANDNPSTPAQLFGTAFHTFLLEPTEFVRTYCLGLRRSDVPEAIDDREQLVAMVQELNSKRLPKLSTSGSKLELINRIMDLRSDAVSADLDPLKATELKAILETENIGRQGLLSVTGSRHDLADILRANGVPVTLWSDVLAEWNANNGERLVLTPEDWDTLHAMRDAVEAHPAARKLLAAPGQAERSVYWTDPVTGILCRCRPDFWRDDGVLVDLKTTEDASPAGFAKSLANWRYHVQAPFYADGINTMRDQAGRTDIVPVKAFVFIAVEKKFPHAVGVYVMDQESTDAGRMQYQADLGVYADCVRSDVWPGYSEKIASISLPGWALAKAAA